MSDSFICVWPKLNKLSQVIGTWCFEYRTHQILGAAGFWWKAEELDGPDKVFTIGITLADDDFRELEFPL